MAPRLAARACIILWCFLAHASGASYQIRFAQGAKQQVGAMKVARGRV